MACCAQIFAKYVRFLGSERFTSEKADGIPKFSKPHSKERVAKEREREGGGGKFSVLQKWLRGDDKCHGEKRSPGRYLLACNNFLIKSLIFQY